MSFDLQASLDAAIERITAKDHEGAERLLLEAAARVPKDFQARYLLGVCHLEAGALDKAEEHLRHVMKVRPHSDKPVYALALLCARTGRQGMADTLMRRFTEIRRAQEGRRVLVLGDSHSEDCFSGISWCDARIPGFYTMHRIGRDGLAALDIAQHGAGPNGTVVFVYGEPDVRLHVGRQRDLFGRDVGEIVADLGRRYFATLRLNTDRFPGLRAIVCSVVPPCDRHPDDFFPKYGAIADRVAFTQLLNAELRRLCARHGFGFLDLYTLFALEDGTMNPIFTDDHIHIKRQLHRIVEHALAGLMDRMGAPGRPADGP